MFENGIMLSVNVENVAESHEHKGRTAILIAIDGRKIVFYYNFM